MRTEKIYGSSASNSFIIERGGLLRHVLFTATATGSGSGDSRAVATLSTLGINDSALAQSPGTLAKAFLTMQAPGGVTVALWLDFIDVIIFDRQRLYLYWTGLEGIQSNIEVAAVLYFEDAPRAI